MSAPDPEKWDTTEEEIDEAWDRESDGAVGSIWVLTQTIASRRALEELMALIDEMASAYYGGKHPDDPGLLAARKIIHDRIAEIKAEEG